MFFDMQNCVYSEGAFNTLNIEIKMLKKVPSEKTQLITVLFLICNSYMS